VNGKRRNSVTAAILLIGLFVLAPHRAIAGGLALSGITVSPEPFFAGETARFSIMVRNLTDAPTPSEVTVILKVANKTGPGFVELYKKEFQVPALAPKETRDVAVPGSWGVPKTHYPQVRVRATVLSAPLTGKLGVSKERVYPGRMMDGGYGYCTVKMPGCGHVAPHRFGG
jgi:hypothetical protein